MASTAERLLYCNPLSLPNFQRGRAAVTKAGGFGWMHDVRRDFREMADPTVVRWEGRWYLYPSAGQLWWSDDLIEWHHRPIEPFDPGYAPTVAVHRDGHLYMTACGDRIWRAPHPLGPWEDVGHVLDENGNRFAWSDPALFLDEDGTLYCYHGLGKDGIYVARLQDDRPWQFAEPRRHCFAFNPEHRWEQRGEYNQDDSTSFIEGAWMTKRHGRYYLQYSGPGTEWRNYCVGVYTSMSPFGPWTPQRRNPILLARRGSFVNGCAHHSIVEGPDGTLWCFYTCLVRIEHAFERRIGMDPVGFDDDGEMYVLGPSETPQLRPGARQRPWLGNDANMLPLSVNQPIRASSHAPGHEPVYANDESIRTWWEAAGGATGPHWLHVDLDRVYQLRCARTCFGDRGLDYTADVLPGPYQYRIEGSTDGQTWTTLCDRSANAVDRHIAFDQWPAVPVRFARLAIIGSPKGIIPSVWEWTLFGARA